MLQKEFHFRSLMVQDEEGRYRLAKPDEIIEAALDEMKRRFRRSHFRAQSPVGAGRTNPGRSAHYTSNSRRIFIH